MEQSGLSKLEVYHVNTRGLIHCCFQSSTPESNQMDLGSSPSQLLTSSVTTGKLPHLSEN